MNILVKTFEGQGANIAVVDDEGGFKTTFGFGLSAMRGVLNLLEGLKDGSLPKPTFTMQGAQVGILVMGVLPSVQGVASINLYDDNAYRFTDTQDGETYNQILILGDGEDVDGSEIIYIGNGPDDMDVAKKEFASVSDDEFMEGLVVPLELLDELIEKLSAAVVELGV